MLEGIRLISFDFDGTICPYSADPCLVENNFYLLLCEIFSLNYVSTMRREQLKDVLGLEKWNGLKRVSYGQVAKSMVIPKETILKLKSLSEKYTLIITTTASLSWVEKILHTNGLDGVFSSIVSTRDHFDRLRLKKPFVFEKIAKDYGLNPEECIHIGDKYYDDYVYPKKANFKAALVRHPGQDVVSLDDLD